MRHVVAHDVAARMRYGFIIPHPVCHGKQPLLSAAVPQFPSSADNDTTIHLQLKTSRYQNILPNQWTSPISADACQLTRVLAFTLIIILPLSALLHGSDST